MKVIIKHIIKIIFGKVKSADFKFMIFINKNSFKL